MPTRLSELGVDPDRGALQHRGFAAIRPSHTGGGAASFRASATVREGHCHWGRQKGRLPASVSAPFGQREARKPLKGL